MDYRALAVLLLRIAGVVVIVQAASNVAISAGFFTDPKYLNWFGIAGLALLMTIPVAVPLLLGLVLIYFPATILSGILKIDGVAEFSSENILPFERVAFSAIGLYLIVSSFLDCVHLYVRTQLYFQIVADWPHGAKPPALTARDFSGLVTAAIQLALGFWLLLGNRGLAALLARLRG